MSELRHPASAVAPSSPSWARVLWRRLRAGAPRRRTADELLLAGRLNGLLYVAGGVATLVALLLPGANVDRPGIVVALAVAGIVWGVPLVLWVRWRRWPGVVVHASSIAGLVIVAIVTALTGGASSPLWALLFLVVIYSAVFYPPRQALAYLAACVVVRALPLLYDDHALAENTLRTMVIVVPIYLLVAAMVVIGRELLVGVAGEKGVLERSERALVGQQSSLRRVATAVAAGAPAEGIFALVSSEAGRLLGARASSIARFDVGGGHAVVTGTWAQGGQETVRGDRRVGTVHAVADRDALARLRAAGGPVCQDRAPAGTLGLPEGSLVAAPVHTGTRVWGAIVVAGAEPFPPGEAERLQEYADLVATAVANAEDRVLLQRQAGRDPLTDLLNHRAFHERLAEEVSRAQRHGRPLVAGVVDVDGFRELDDRVGADAAEAALVQIAARVRDAVRDEDVVARLSGDRFGVIFVESDIDEAYGAAERARGAIAGRPLRHGIDATVTVGLCDIDHAVMGADLVRRAAAAVERCQAAGGNAIGVYELEARGAGREPPADDRDRSHGLLGLRALARAIDARDTATQEHSDRVASLVTRMAVARGWDDRSIGRLREAALLHDVGKIGVPDDVLLKPGPLTGPEREVVKEHAALGAHMVTGVLEDEQVRWVGALHERPDGAGYPQALNASAIPEGAALLAVADAWDMMTRGRHAGVRRSADDALAEMRALAGLQFSAEAVAALEVVHDRGQLTSVAARLHAPGGEAA